MLTCRFCKISQSHEECWLILTGIPSLLLGSISCWMVSSAVWCWLPFSVARRQLPSVGCFVQQPTGVPLPTSVRAEISSPNHLSGFAPTDKGVVCLADHLHRVTRFCFGQPLMCGISELWFGLVYFFNGISTLFRLFNAKAILLEEQWYYLTHSWEGKGVRTFPKGICPKVNVIARLEYELAYYDSAVHPFNHYTTRTSFSGTI